MPGEVSDLADNPDQDDVLEHIVAIATPVLVDVAAGETARVVIGGTGRPVVGKVTAPGAIAGPVDWSCSRNWLTRKQRPVTSRRSGRRGEAEVA